MSTQLAEHAAQSIPPSRMRPSADWPALRNADRACCCSARPACIAIMPPANGREHDTDLLLCGHHYRVLRQALAAAGAYVLDEQSRRIALQADAFSAIR
jgi:hypothetical protein